ncbi:hypothetical protein CsSME_00003066 [Camellia sinensis var. sinensis]
MVIVIIGSSFFSIGTDISIDVGARQFAKYNASLSFNTAILIISLTLASCHHTICPLTNITIAAELTHKFLRNETTLTFGTKDPQQWKTRRPCSARVVSIILLDCNQRCGCLGCDEEHKARAVFGF